MQSVVMGSLGRVEKLSEDAVNRITNLEGISAEDKQTITQLNSVCTITKLTNVCDITAYHGVANA